MNKLYFIITILLFSLLSGCGDDSPLPDPKKIVNAKHIDINPFLQSVEEWATQTQKYFQCDSLLGFWEVKNFYIAVYRKGEWLHIYHVANESFVSSKSILSLNILDDNRQFINDNGKMRLALEKDPTLGRKMVFYQDKYALNSIRIIFDQKYLHKKVNIEVTILEKTKIEDAEKSKPDLISSIIIN